MNRRLLVSVKTEKLFLIALPSKGRPNKTTWKKNRKCFGYGSQWKNLQSKFREKSHLWQEYWLHECDSSGQLMCLFLFLKKNRLPWKDPSQFELDDLILMCLYFRSPKVIWANRPLFYSQKSFFFLFVLDLFTKYR